MTQKKRLDMSSSNIQSLIDQQLNTILQSDTFSNAPKMCSLLKYIVEKKRNNQSERLKQFTIAVEVFGRDQNFDPQADPIVRVQMGRLRQALTLYYLTKGLEDKILFEIPKGSYVIQFTSIDEQQNTESNANQIQSVPKSPLGQLPEVEVYPFTCHTNDPELNSLASGFCEEISLELSRFYNLSISQNPNRNLLHNTNQHNKSLFSISGSIHQFGKKIRIHAWLQERDNNKQVWAKRYDFINSQNDLFSILDEVNYSIITEIASTFGVIHQHLYHRHVAEKDHLCSPNYYQASLKYRHYLMTLSKHSFDSALHCALGAEANTPEDISIWILLSALYLDASTLNIAEIQNAKQKAIEYAHRVFAMEPNRQDAAMLQALLYQADGNVTGVINSAERVIELNPYNNYMVGLAGQLLCLAGKFDRGRKLITQSNELNVYQPAWFNLAHYLYYFKHNEYELALEQINLYSQPTLFWFPLLKAAALQRLGFTEEAKNAYQEVLLLCPDFSYTMRKRITSYVVNSDLADMLVYALNEILQYSEP